MSGSVARVSGMAAVVLTAVLEAIATAIIGLVLGCSPARPRGGSVRTAIVVTGPVTSGITAIFTTGERPISLIKMRIPE